MTSTNTANTANAAELNRLIVSIRARASRLAAEMVKKDDREQFEQVRDALMAMDTSLRGLSEIGAREVQRGVWYRLTDVLCTRVDTLGDIVRSYEPKYGLLVG